MFIIIAYKDAAELSTIRRRSSETDLSTEKTLLVNPDCQVRVMLEHIRKRCRLGVFTQFDLSDEGGTLMRLFGMPTFANVKDLFEHKKTYYIVVLRMEADKRISVLPQLNWENKFYPELKARVQKFLASGEWSPDQATSPGAKVLAVSPAKQPPASAAGKPPASAAKSAKKK